jgi:hypothetical protein
MKNLLVWLFFAVALIGAIPAAQARWNPNGYVAVGPWIRCWWKNPATGRVVMTEGWWKCPRP